jgi:endonuclease YncB( thermonuclease family)
VQVEEHGIDRYERTLATLYVYQDGKSEWMNVNERMVTLGHAWVMRRFYTHLPKHWQDTLNQLVRWQNQNRSDYGKHPTLLLHGNGEMVIRKPNEFGE